MYTEASLQYSYDGHTGSQGNSKVKHPRLNIVLGVVTAPYAVTQRLVEPTSRRSSIAGVGRGSVALTPARFKLYVKLLFELNLLFICAIMFASAGHIAPSTLTVISLKGFLLDL